MALDGIATVAQLATKLSRSEADVRALLDELAVPYPHDVVSVHALEAALARGESATAGLRSPSDILHEVLPGLGLELTKFRSGRPTTGEVTAIGPPLMFGEHGLASPVLIGPDLPARVRVYSAKDWVQGRAGFTLSGFLEESPEVLYLLVLRSRARVWGLTAGELVYLYNEVPKRAAEGKAGQWLKMFVRPKGRDGVLRASLPKTPGDFDLDGRLTPLTGEQA
jgi:hypothetical protein